MPSGIFYPIEDRKSGKTYKMPWHDSVTKPSTAQIRQFIEQEENPSLWQTLNKPLTDLPQKILNPISESLHRYGEGGSDHPYLRRAAQIGGAFTEGVGDVLNTMTSPISIATMGAGPVASRIPKLAGAARGVQLGAAGSQVGAGAYSIYDDPSWENVKGNLPGMAIGALGLGVAPSAARMLPKSVQDFGRGTFGKMKGTPKPPPVAGEAPAVSLSQPSRTTKIPYGENAPDAIDFTQPRQAAGVYPEYTQNPLPLASQRIPDVSDLPLFGETPRPPSQALQLFGGRKPVPPKPVRGAQRPPPGEVGPFEAGESTLGDIAADVGHVEPYTPPKKKPTLFKRKEEYEPTRTPRETAEAEWYRNLEEARAETNAMRGKARKRSPFGSETGAASLSPLDELGNWLTNKPSATFSERIKTAVKGVPKIGPELAESGGAIEGMGQSGWHIIKKYGGQDIADKLRKARLDIDQLAERGLITLDKDVPVSTYIRKIMGPEIDDAIKLTKNPEKVQRVVDKWWGRTETPNKEFSTPVKALTALQSAAKLSNFFISNTSGLGNTFLRGNTKEAIKATWRTLTDFKNAASEAQQTGALRPVLDAIGHELKDSGGIGDMIDKYYGISLAEKGQRTIAALTGKGTAQSLFEKLKANPNHKLSRARLKDLLLEDVDEVLKQPKLTPEQANRAGASMSELTQGRAESIDLPPWWSGSPEVNLITQFKRYSFVQTKNMKDAFKQNPLKTAAVIGTVFPALGELVGNTKAGIKGAARAIWNKEDIQKAIGEEVAGRGEGLDRYYNDLVQAWGLGILGDLYEGSQRGPTGVLETLAGPLAGDISTAAHGAHRASQGNWGPLKRQAVRMIPWVGTGLASGIKDTQLAGPRRRQRKTRSRPSNP